MRKSILSLICLASLFLAAPARADNNKARDIVSAAIEALGGKNYINVKNSHSSGNYFTFDREGRKGFAQYLDWTNLDPIKWRFQLGQGKNQNVDIYNLELNKGWSLEGKDIVKDAKPEEVDEFKKSAKRDLDLILHKRVNEEGMNLYYYSPEDVAGTGEAEAVEFLDATNTSVIIFFDTKTHLPVKSESEVTDKMGIRHKEEVEYLNWHEIQNVNSPLRIDVSVDGQISQQRFIEKLEYNLDLPEDLFLEPKIIEKKK